MQQWVLPVLWPHVPTPDPGLPGGLLGGRQMSGFGGDMGSRPAWMLPTL